MTRGGYNNRGLTYSNRNMFSDDFNSRGGYNRRGRGRGRARGRTTRGVRGTRMRGTGRGRPMSRDTNMIRGVNNRSSIYRQPMKRGLSNSCIQMGGRWRSMNNGRMEPLNRRNNVNIQTTGKVIVSNLGDHVTSDDVKEIFEKTGTITQAFVKFDKSGKSTGTAEVVYARKNDARIAQRDLDGAQVDGKTIRVNLSPESSNLTRNFSSRGRALNRGSTGRQYRGTGRFNSGYTNDNFNNRTQY